MELPLAEFKTFVSVLQSFAAPREIVPILKHLVFDNNRIYAGDGTGGAIMETPWNFTKELGASFTVHSDRLSKLLTALEGVSETVELKLQKTGVLRFSGKGFKADFATLDPKDFPYPQLPAKAKAMLVDSGWGKAIVRTVFSVSKDETKPQLRGVWISKGMARSSDNTRATRVRCPAPDDALLPETMLTRMGALVDEVTHIAMTENQVVLYTLTGTFFTSQISSEFPNLDLAFKTLNLNLKGSKDLLGVRSKEVGPLAMALRRVLLFSEDDFNSRLQCTLKKGKGILVETVNRNGVEHADEWVVATVEGPGKADVVFQINGKLLLEAWEKCPRFYTSNDTGLHLYFLAEDKTYEHLLVKMVV